MLPCFWVLLTLITENKAVGQTSSSAYWNKIISVEDNEDLSIAEKLFECEKIKKSFDDNNLIPDSVYARLLHRIAALRFQLNNMVATEQVIEYTGKAIQLNNSGRKDCSPYFAINSYVNLGIYYRTIKFYKKAYAYYDSAITRNNNYKLNNSIADLCYINKVEISIQLGDYQKGIEDCTKGLFAAQRSGRTDLSTALFNQRGQAYFYLKLLKPAIADVDSAIKYARSLNSNYELATAFKTKALLETEAGNYNNALKLFSEAIAYRISTGNLAQIADDYTDFGNFYIHKKEYSKAIDCYNKTIQYANEANDAERLCKGYTNLGEVFFLKASGNDYGKSEEYYQKALDVFKIHKRSLYENPSLLKLSSIGNTDLLLALLDNKTELLLHLYKSSQKREYLDACINTGMLMDSAINSARHEQTNETSKLYWRNSTRDFFKNILEACFLANDATLCFYFMEKSRAVLLNDKLNETAASIRLPEDENFKEQQFKFKLVEARMQMNNTDIHHNDYNKNQLRFLQVKDEFEHYIKTLEQKYPAYYKYKYDDGIPSLHMLQQRLLKNDETFVHYFIEDSVVYILVINGGNSRIIKHDGQGFHERDLKLLIDFCADKQKLNNRYGEFASLSNKLYNILFAGLNIPSGRVIISQDNTLIPYEILSKDESGKKFLLYDYTFSYVYSASFLLKEAVNQHAHGNFIGFAPVSFKPDLKLPDLKNAASALEKSADHYSDMLLLDNNNATRKSFLSQVAKYNIVSVFSHAFADTMNNEPVLFMYDSMINLSELQLLNNPATQLVILSACQTNVGRNETGEGIYSLARGFASAGIPAVSATLWKADENAIYQITDKFNEYIAKGARKDEALRSAKLNFIEGTSNEKLLPYYWANMVLIGKSDPVNLLPGRASISLILWGIIGVLIVIALLFTIKYYLNKKNQLKT